MNALAETFIGNLSGQVAIVTGGGRGIGRSISQSLSKAGAKVVVAARSADQLQETVRLIEQHGGHAMAFMLDVTNQAAIEQMVMETIKQFGAIDLLVNNAGISGEEGAIWDVAGDDWWRVLEVNLQGPFLCARAILPTMIAQHHGRIINIASNAGLRPSANFSAYAVSKAALLRLTDSLALMASEHNISAFAISPGLVLTAMTQDISMFKDTPDLDWTSVERAGELCVFLATGKADRLSGRYIHVLDDINQLLDRADEIEEKNLYSLGLCD